MPESLVVFLAEYFVVDTIVVSVFLYLAVVAVSYGLSASQARKAKRRARDAYNQSLEDRLVMQTSFDGVRSRIYGRIRNVDGIVFKGTHGQHLELYTLVVALAGHEIDGIEEIFLNDLSVQLDSDGNVVTPPYYVEDNISETEDVQVVDGIGVVNLAFEPLNDSVSAVIGGGDFANAGTVVSIVGTLLTLSFENPVTGTATINYQYLKGTSTARILKFLGEPGQDLSPYLIDKFPDLISSTDKFQGYAALILEFRFDPNVFLQGLPGASVVMRGAKIKDIRTGITEWTDNPALIAYDWARYSNGGNCLEGEIDEASFIAAANSCDIETEFETPDGTEVRPLYQCGISCRLDGNPDDWMDEIVESMAGKWAFAGGKVKTVAGVFRSPVATLDESWAAFAEGENADDKQITIVRQALADVVNIYRPTIADSEQDYVPAVMPQLISEAYIEADGQELPRETALSGVTHNVQAQHICGVFLRDAREDLTMTIPCNMRAWTVELFDVLYVNLPHFGFDNKLFEVLGWKFSPQGGVELNLKETGASIFDVDANFDNPNAEPNTALPDPWNVEQLEDLTAESGSDQLLVQSDGTILTRVLISWYPVEDASVTNAGHIDIWWRLVNSDSQIWNTMRVAGDQYSAYINNVPDGEYILIKARACSTIVNGGWSIQVNHLVVGKTELPPPVERLKLIEQPGGVRQFFWDYTNAPVDLFAFEAAYSIGTGNRPWAELISLFAKDRNARQTDTSDPQNDGVYTFAIRAIDTTGNASTPIYITEVLDGDNFGNVLLMVLPHEEGWPGTKTDCDVAGTELQNAGTLTWDDFDIAWDGTEEVWNNTPISPIVYEHTPVDLGSSIEVTIRTNQLVSGIAFAELATSDDGITYTSFGAVPSGTVTAQYFIFRWTVTGTDPVMYRAQAIFYT